MFVPIFILCLFLTGALVCVLRTLPIAFAVVYMPTLIMMSNTSPVDMPGMPDINPPMAVGAGIVFGLLLKGGEQLLFRWTLVDTIIVSLSCCAVMTGWVTNTFYTGVHIIGFQALDLVVPYFLARWAFHSPMARKAGLTAIVTCVCILALFAPIEMRLWPYYLNRLLNTFAPRQRAIRKALTRFGFYRAGLSFLHPIDMGDSCIILTGMIATLGASSIVGLNNVFVLAGLAGGLICVACSLSFGPFFACSIAGTFFYLMYVSRWVRANVVLIVLGIALTLCGMTYSLTHANTYIHKDLPPFERSYRIRALIATNSMPFVKSAGFFGYGEKINQSTLQLKSVDNSYLLFAMTRGWLYTGMWIAIPFVIAWRVQRSFRNARSKLEIIALSACCATVIGINIAMFTVWAGSIYAKIWLIMVAFTVSLTEWFLSPVIIPAGEMAQVVYRPAGPPRRLTPATSPTPAT